jgi:predicted AlkP superfamily pyrophosphatase or phosphodiesterase
MKILVVSFDGLQPSQINEDLMPNLYGYLNDGVTFTNHHAVYPSVTRINSTSMFTGRYPGSHGIAANSVVMRDFQPNLVFSVMQPMLENIREKLGDVLYVENLGDILNNFGEKFVAVGAGTTGNSFLQNPNAHKNGGAVVNPEFTLPYSLEKTLKSTVGDWPSESIPNEKRLRHCVDIMTKYVIPKINPTVGLIWFSEPDKSHHADGVGNELGTQAIKYADKCFGDLISKIRKIENSKDANVIIISDHGYSTIKGVIDIKEELIKVGLLENEHDNKILIAPNGGSVLFYVENSENKLATKLARTLMQFEWCGPMFYSSNTGKIEGLLPAELIGIEGPRCPDVTMSFQWNSEKNIAGYKGMIYSAGGDKNLGTHGSISKHEMNNVFGAFGPDFKKGLVCSTPTGNVDLTPTIIHLLGLKTNIPFDGRPIREALLEGVNHENIKVNIEEFKSEYSNEGFSYKQKLVTSSVENTHYIDYAERN